MKNKATNLMDKIATKAQELKSQGVTKQEVYHHMKAKGLRVGYFARVAIEEVYNEAK